MEVVSANPRQDEDLALVQAAQSGHDNAMASLLCRYEALVRAKARSYFLLGADNEDVIQEGMIGVFKAVRDYDCRRSSSFYSFAVLCITRQIITAVKAAGRQKHLPLRGYVSFNAPVAVDSATSYGETLPCSRAGPEEILVANENEAELTARIVERLTPLERKVLSLYLRGMSFEGIARCLNRGYKSVDNAVWRIKRKLRSGPTP